jgi:hypothetical protein
MAAGSVTDAGCKLQFLTTGVSGRLGHGAVSSFLIVLPVLPEINISISEPSLLSFLRSLKKLSAT